MTREEKQKAIDALKISAPVMAVTQEEFNDYIQTLNNYIQTLNKIMDWLEQEPCEDAISRQAVLDGLASIAKAKAKSDAQKSLMGRVMFFVEQTPSVQPKTGHWSHDGSHWENRWICSECGYKLFDEQTNYCPNCGAKMEVEE